MLNISSIDEFVSQHSKFCLLDWLIANQWLSYTDYENWRHTKLDNLDDVIQIDNKKLSQLITQTEELASSLKLTAQTQEYYSWNNEIQKKLTLSANSKIHQALSNSWLRAKDLPQLDLFMDNSAQLAEHRVIELLSARQFSQAQHSLNQLAEINSACQFIGNYQDLINYGLYLQSEAHLESDSLADDRMVLVNEVIPLATETLGHYSRDYLAFAWRALADCLTAKQYCTETPELHESSLLMQIPDYPGALVVLQQQELLYQDKQLMFSLAQCYLATQQTDKALFVWVLLLEMDSEFAVEQLQLQSYYLISDYWYDFIDCCDEQLTTATSHTEEKIDDEIDDKIDDKVLGKLFAAYVFLRQSALIHQLDNFPVITNSATLAMIALVEARVNKRDEIDARKALSIVSPLLLKIYLASTNEQ